MFYFYLYNYDAIIVLSTQTCAFIIFGDKDSYANEVFNSFTFFILCINNKNSKYQVVVAAHSGEDAEFLCCSWECSTFPVFVYKKHIFACKAVEED